MMGALKVKRVELARLLCSHFSYLQIRLKHSTWILVIIVEILNGVLSNVYVNLALAERWLNTDPCTLADVMAFAKLYRYRVNLQFTQPIGHLVQWVIY